MKRIFITGLSVLLVFLLIFVRQEKVVARKYRPELSGDLTFGNRSYQDPDIDLLDGEDNLIDRYDYRRFWLKYRQKLSPAAYYYYKVQYNQKQYLEKTQYNNITLNFWTNYTYPLTTKFRNCWKLNLRDKSYDSKVENSYRLISLGYQLDYQYSKQTDYSIQFQRKWEVYTRNIIKNNFTDQIALSGSFKLSDHLNISTDLKWNRVLFKPGSLSNNKINREIGVGFKVKL